MHSIYVLTDDGMALTCQIFARIVRECLHCVQTAMSSEAEDGSVRGRMMGSVVLGAIGPSIN